MNREDKISKALQEQSYQAWRAVHSEAPDMFVWDSITLQGSQNYGTDHEGSDVDSKFIIVPKVEAMLRRVSVSQELVLPDNSHVAIKTFPEFAELFFKGNVNNLEILYTPYVFPGSGLLDRIRPLRTQIVKSVEQTLLNASFGMMIQKRRSMLKGTVTTAPFVEKHGYDCKDAIHILRLACLISDTIHGKPFEEALIVDHLVRPFMFSLREGYMPVEKVLAWADKVIADTEKEVSDAGIKTDMDTVNSLKKQVMDEYVDWYKEFML